MYKYRGRYYDSYVAPIDERVRHGGTFKNKFEVIGRGKLGLGVDSSLFFDQIDNGKVKHGGWKYEIMLRRELDATSSIELGTQHMSRHVFEEERPQHFDTYDRWTLRLVLFKKVK